MATASEGEVAHMLNVFAARRRLRRECANDDSAVRLKPHTEVFVSDDGLHGAQGAFEVALAERASPTRRLGWRYVARLNGSRGKHRTTGLGLPRRKPRRHSEAK